ncbi:MAG TPA: CBS domain-containing protein [Pyrinomonadaceae bacterium]|jgi:CBS domain-containing protein
MVMFSALRRFTLVDESGARARLLDASIELLEEDYPPVTQLFFLDGGGRRSTLPWESVRGFDWRAREVRVDGLSSGRRAPTDSLSKEVLLGRDVMDALVLDLQNRMATRANDLSLEEDDGRLLLRAADTSARAVLRRLTRGLFGHTPENMLYDWKYVEFLRGDPRAVRNGAGYHLRIKRLPPGEIARIAEEIPYLHAAELLTLLPDPIAAATIEAMSPERQLQVFEELDEEQGRRLLEEMSPDVAADIVGRLQPDEARLYLERLPKETGERVVELLRYPEDTVGGIMTNEVVSLPEHLTVAEARERARSRIKEARFVFLIYVVADDESKELRGLISLRNLFIAGDDERLAEIMDPFVTVLHPLDDATDAAYRVINSHLAAMPVVDQGRKLVGVVTVDAAVALVAPSDWRGQAPRVFS